MIGNNCNDVLLVRDTNGCGNGNGAWGDGAWWIIILFLFVFCGWGNGNWGNGGGFGGAGSGYTSDNYALITDNATLERKIDGVYSGICDSTFALNNTITNGFASAQNTMTHGFAGLNTAMIQQGYEGRIATQNVANAVQNCCCDLRQQIGDVNYNLATQANGINNTINSGFCQTNFNAQTNTRDIIDSQNTGTRAILDKLCQMEVNAKDEKIAEQAQKINALQLAASQAAQNDYIINQLRPAPVPAFAVPNPYAYNNCNCGGCC